MPAPRPKTLLVPRAQRTPTPVPQPNTLLVPKASIRIRASAPIATAHTYKPQAKAAAPSNDDDAEVRRGATDERDHAGHWQASVDEGAIQVGALLDTVRSQVNPNQASAIATDETATITAEELRACLQRWRDRRLKSS